MEGFATPIAIANERLEVASLECGAATEEEETPLQPPCHIGNRRRLVAVAVSIAGALVALSLVAHRASIAQGAEPTALTAAAAVDGTVQLSSDGETCEEGIDFNSNDIKSINSGVTSPAECQSQCQAEADCKFWTFETSYKHCHLKSSAAGRQEKTGSTSGPRAAYEEGIDFNGNDVQSINSGVTSPAECQSECEAKADCKFWTFETNHKHCHLKSSDAGRQEKTGSTSGTRTCAAAELAE